jgi:hypothetical protein
VQNVSAMPLVNAIRCHLTLPERGKITLASLLDSEYLSDATLFDDVKCSECQKEKFDVTLCGRRLASQ